VARPKGASACINNISNISNISLPGSRRSFNLLLQ
jgi:hypothetical protein